MSNGKNKKISQSVTISLRTLVILLAAVVVLVAGGATLGLNWNRWFARTHRIPSRSPRTLTPTQATGKVTSCRIRPAGRPWASKSPATRPSPFPQISRR